MTDLARAALLATSALLALLAACAAPGGAAPDGGVAAANGNSCNPGEVQVCELKTPHRVSDGRYGFRGNTRKSCSCQPDSDLQRMSRETLPGDQF
ncbi:MAG: hypothetical protein OEW35_08865 [Gammaproteobacteria bacterium]|nr:hypothetical protein [Gammaproteobacteria bacterium]MDH4253573.1 hypothetical protein [Gammaproteobacteria bacterium]MDH5310158.1 hypothetical protein [Gammaproteobacteria bacterium]